jgi:hypothetical protein
LKKLKKEKEERKRIKKMSYLPNENTNFQKYNLILEDFYRVEGDSESMHVYEDSLMVNLIQDIANQKLRPDEILLIAKIIKTINDDSYERWYS